MFFNLNFRVQFAGAARSGEHELSKQSEMNRAPWHGSQDARYCRGGSELELGTELEHARIVGRGHLAKRRVVRTRIDILELCVIEGVEAFKT